MLITTLFLSFIVISYFLIRLAWLKRFQLTLLVRSVRLYQKLPSLQYMLWKKFWIWDEIRFLPDLEDE